MTRTIIIGAAGRDFHLFNVCFRDDPNTRVVAFTAAQIPHIDDRRYPPALSGPYHPEGIPIVPEDNLERIIARERVERAIFAYSDVPHSHVDALRARVEAAGAAFETFDVDATMLPSQRPVIAVTAVRTGCGKSQTSRYIATALAAAGHQVVAIRHPMPYGDLAAQRVQRYASLEDLERFDCTIEEMEEYEPHIRAGVIIYAGVDYAAILAEAEAEADVIIWDGGNNDTPFYRPDLWITVCDPHRAGHELAYFPSDVNFRRADILLINKVDSAEQSQIEQLEATARSENPEALLLRASSPVSVPDPAAIAGKRVLAVEDGPTLTHGGMLFGAGVIAAKRFGAAEIVDPRPWLAGELLDTFRAYPEIGHLLPAMGYGEKQIDDLEQTINAVPCDMVLVGTPIDLNRVIDIAHPSQRVSYALEEPSGQLRDAVLALAAR